LTEFSRQWARESVDDQGNLEAFRLLSQKNFDAKKLFEDVSSIQVKVIKDFELLADDALLIAGHFLCTLDC